MAQRSDDRADDRRVLLVELLWAVALRFTGLNAAAAVYQGRAVDSAVENGFRAGQLLARAYYRLWRALWTGYTFPDRGAVAGDSVSLGDLYSDFETLVFRVVPADRHVDLRRFMGRVLSVDDAVSVYREAQGFFFPDDESRDRLIEFVESDRALADSNGLFTSADGDDYGVDDSGVADFSDLEYALVEGLKDANGHLREVYANEVEAVRSARDSLLEARRRELAELKRLEARAARRAWNERVLRRKRLTAKRKAAARRAAFALRGSYSGARGELQSIMSRDGRVAGFVRVPESPTPCAFCLVLASRGISFPYKSRESASSAWHEHCQCSVHPIFSRDNYFNSPLFAKNRALHNIWKDVDKASRKAGGTGSRDSFKKFRSFFESSYAKGGSLDSVLRDNDSKFG